MGGALSDEVPYLIYAHEYQILLIYLKGQYANMRKLQEVACHICQFQYH